MLNTCDDLIGWDAVTKLPNRLLFKAAYHAVPRTRLVMVTVSGAADYNRLLRAVGHDLADDFVRGCAARLQAQLRPTQPLYHVALLSFVFICRTPDCDDQLHAIAAAFRQPLVCANIPMMADTAIGLADCNDHDAGVMLRASLTATQDCRAKGLDLSNYDQNSDQANLRGFFLLSALNGALYRHNGEPEQFRLNFQPKYDLVSGQVTSAEALVRWMHPELGLISPAEFIPLAESTMHIHALTNWVIETALAQASLWRAMGASIRLAINISPRNLGQTGFARRALERLSAYDVAPAMIELEFTEGLLALNDPVVLVELQMLRAAGIRIAVDDFGTGFANFSYFTKLPADIIKIDKSFILKVGADARAAAVVKSIIELAQRLGYVVVAEGIETADVYEMLAGWGCNEGQGFLMSRPLEPAAFAASLNQAYVRAP